MVILPITQNAPRLAIQLRGRFSVPTWGILIFCPYALPALAHLCPFSTPRGESLLLHTTDR